MLSQVWNSIILVVASLLSAISSSYKTSVLERLQVDSSFFHVILSVIQLPVSLLWYFQ